MQLAAILQHDADALPSNTAEQLCGSAQHSTFIARAWVAGSDRAAGVSSASPKRPSSRAFATTNCALNWLRTSRRCCLASVGHDRQRLHRCWKSITWSRSPKEKPVKFQATRQRDEVTHGIWLDRGLEEAPLLTQAVANLGVICGAFAQVRFGIQLNLPHRAGVGRSETAARRDVLLQRIPARALNLDAAAADQAPPRGRPDTRGGGDVFDDDERFLRQAE